MTMKEYPSSGDSGKSKLLDGRVGTKDTEVFDAIGSLDELNCFLGWCAAADNKLLDQEIAQVQNDLFSIGVHLARGKGQGFDAQATDRLEQQIKKYWKQLPSMKGFVIPGGCELASRLHIARAACRRAERRLVRLAVVQDLQEQVLQYINRLSDWLFVQARTANLNAGHGEQCQSDNRTNKPS